MSVRGAGRAVRLASGGPGPDGRGDDLEQMAAGEQRSELGPGDATVCVVSPDAIEHARLSAQEGYVLSRVDGATSLEMLCLSTGLGTETTTEILRELRDKGLITIGDEEPRRPPPEPRPSADEEPVAEGEPSATEYHARPPRRRGTRQRPSGELSPGASATDAVESEQPGGEVDALPEEEDSDLPEEVRLEIRRFHEQLGQLSLFEVLGVGPYADAKEVRKAYFARSKQFHPDRFYRRRLGPYQEMLQEIFKQVRAAQRFLSDDGQREAYRQMVEDQREQEELAQQVRDQGERAMREDSVDGSAGPPVFRFRKRTRSQRSARIRKALVELARPETGERVGPPTPPTTERVELPDDDPQRRQRRREDRLRRQSKLTAGLMERAKRSAEFYRQGMAQLERQHYLAAAASLQLAVAYNPDSEEYRQAFEEASDKARGATADNYYTRAKFEESVGRYDAAGEHYIRAAEAQPAAAYQRKAAEACIWSGELIMAKDYATKAVQSEPNDVENRLMLAKVYIEAKLGRNAKRELQMALKLDPRNSEAKELLKHAR